MTPFADNMGGILCLMNLILLLFLFKTLQLLFYLLLLEKHRNVVKCNLAQRIDLLGRLSFVAAVHLVSVEQARVRSGSSYQ